MQIGGNDKSASWLRLDLLTLPILALVAAVAMFLIWIGVYYAQQPLLEAEAWRQTQTALTAYWMLKEGWRLAYQTPVLGYPWEIPLEFPVYQTIVALIVWLTNVPLDPAGRLVSLVFLIACALPAFQIAKRLTLPAETTWIFCALLWSAPIYIFNGRSFSIETAALFFTFAAIPYALDLREAQPRLSSAVAFACLMTLGMLQKVSTAFPVLLVLGALCLILHLRDYGLRLPERRKLLIIIIAFATPLFCTLLWFAYGEMIRSENKLIGDNESMINSWFGGERTTLEAYIMIYWDRMIVQNAGGTIGTLVIVAGILFGSHRLRATVFVSIIIWFLISFIFMRHHNFIYYYQTANTLYLIGAVSVSIAAVAHYFQKPIIALVLCASIVVSNMYSFYTGYWGYIRKDLTLNNNATLAVSDVVRRYTPSDSAVIVFGLMSTDSLKPISAWSSEIAYYSERKSLTVAKSRANENVWSDPAAFIGDKELGAIVFCSKKNRDRYEEILKKYGSERLPSLFKVKNCHVWLPGIPSIVLADGKEVHPTKTF